MIEKSSVVVDFFGFVLSMYGVGLVWGYGGKGGRRLGGIEEWRECFLREGRKGGGVETLD